MGEVQAWGMHSSCSCIGGLPQARPQMFNVRLARQRYNHFRWKDRSLHKTLNRIHEEQVRSKRQSVLLAGLAEPDLLDNLDAPDIEGDLSSYQAEAGALFSEEGVALTFNNEAEAAEALEHDIVVIDRSHCGRLRLSGDDRLSFLHGVCYCPEPDIGLGNLLCAAKWGTLWETWDLGVAVAEYTIALPPGGEPHLAGMVLVCVSPSMRRPLLERLRQYILYGDKVEVTDVSDQCGQLVVAGPRATYVLEGLGVNLQEGRPHASHTLLSLGGSPVVVAAGSGLPAPGWTLLADVMVLGELWKTLVRKGAVPMGEEGWERARVLAGRPAPGAELTEAFNPYEAGLCNAVRVDKGCYIGQEALAKLSKLQSCKQQLWGVRLSEKARTGDIVRAGEKTVGLVTSVCETVEGNAFALAYIKTKVGGEQLDLQDGLPVQVEGTRAELADIPFACRTLPQPPVEPVPGSSAPLEDAADKAAQEAAKEARLKAMQERLAAWQKQQHPGS